MSYDLIQEEVPPFVRRIGDLVFQGSNNSMLVLGTDRAKDGPAGLADGLGHSRGPDGGRGAGAGYFVVGRHAASGDPDLRRDDSYVYISMKTDSDANLGLGSLEVDARAAPAAIVKSDHVRIVCRKDAKICLDNGESSIFLDRDKVKIAVGKNVVELNRRELSADLGASKIKASTSGEISAKNGPCELKMDPAQVVASGPFFKIGGPAANFWIGLINTLLAAAVNHTHMTIVGPTLPAGVAAPGPSSVVGPVVPLTPNEPILGPLQPALTALEQACFKK